MQELILRLQTQWDIINIRKKTVNKQEMISV